MDYEHINLQFMHIFIYIHILYNDTIVIKEEQKEVRECDLAPCMMYNHTVNDRKKNVSYICYEIKV